MGFARFAGLTLVGLIMVLSISCEKHHLGEYPEVQRDRLAEAKKASRSEQSGVPVASATPVRFFPEKKSP